MKLYLLAFVTCLVSLNLSELIGRNIEYDTTYVLSKSEIVIDLSPKARIHETNVLNFIDSGTLNTYGKEVWLLLKENNWNYNTLLKTFEP